MDQLYFESGYIVDGYYTIVREAAAGLNVTATFTVDGIIAVTTGYFLDDYIAVGYFVVVGEVKQAEAVFSATLTSAATATRIIESTAAFTAAFAPTLTAEGIKNSTAVLDSVSTMTVDAVANKAANILLAHIANLNAQAAKTAVVDSTMATTISISSAPTKSVVTSATFASTVTFTCEAFNVTFFDAQFVSTTSIFTSRYLGSHRPTDIVEGSPVYDSGEKKFGTHSLSGSSEIRNGLFSSSSPSYRPQPPQVNQDWVVEAWIYKSSLTAGTSIGGNVWIQLGVSSGNALYVTLNSSNYTQRVLINVGTGFTLTTNAWNHIAIVKNSSRISVYRNGTRIGTSTTLPTSYFYHQPDTIGNAYFGFVASEPTANRNRLDEFAIHVGTTLGYDPSSSTITVPTEARVNDPVYTRLLHHFDNNGLDDISVTQSVSAAFVSTASVTVLANTSTKQAAASLGSSASVTVNAIKAVSVNSALSSASSLTTVIGLIKDIVSSQTVTATISAQAERIKQITVDFGALFAPSISINVVVNPFATLESTATISVIAVKTTGITKTLSATVTQSTIANKFADITQTLSATASVSAIAGIRKSAQAAVAAQATMVTIGISPSLASANLQSQFTIIASGPRNIGRPLNITTLGGGSFGAGQYGQAYQVDSAAVGWTLPTSNKYATAGIVDFWLGIAPASGPNNVSSTVFEYGNKWTITVLYTAAPNNHYIYFNGVQVGAAIGIFGGGFNWRQIRVTRSGNNYTISANSATYTITNATAFSGTIRFKPIISVNQFAIDELLITNQNGITNQITTAPFSFSDQTDVVGLWHFDNNGLDDVSIKGTLEAAITATAGITASTTINFDAGANLNSAVSINTQAIKTAQGVAAMSATASLSLTYTRVRTNASFQPVVATVSTAAVKTTDTALSAVSTVTQTTVGTRIRFANISFESIATNLTAAFKNATGTVLLETQSQMQITAEKNAVGVVAVAAQFTQSTDTADAKIVRMSAAVSAQFTQSTQGDRIQPAGSAMASAFTQSTNTANSKTTRVNAVFGVTVSLSAQGDRFRDGIALQASLGTLSCSIDKLRQGSASFVDSFDLLASPQYIIRITATFTAFNSLLTVGEVINIDPDLTLTITAESRGLRILPENREISIESETRVNII